MTTLNKQECGTLGAYRWFNGIKLGIYGKHVFASFEYDSNTKELSLLINEDYLAENNVKVKFVRGKEWS